MGPDSESPPTHQSFFNIDADICWDAAFSAALNGADATGCDWRLARASDLRNNPWGRPCHGEAANLGGSTSRGMNHARRIATVHFGEFRKKRTEAIDERSTGH